MTTRVVVTGMGCVTPNGNTVNATWSSILQGKSGIGPITNFDHSDLRVHIAGELKIDLLEFYRKKDLRRMDPFTAVGLIAADEAMKEIEIENPRRFGVMVGSGCGGLSNGVSAMNTIVNKGTRMLPPTIVPATIPNAVAGAIAVKYGAFGPISCPVAACATGSQAIGMAYREIREGRADIMLAGGSEVASCEFGIGGFSALRVLSDSTEPTTASRPFDINRNGFVLSDGAGIVILESLESAKSRGAKIYAEVTGFDMCGGASINAAADLIGLDYESITHCMKNALAEADLTEVDHINAHATSTVDGDPIEAKAINDLFSNRPLVSATKSMTGHMLGASGAVEFIFTCLALYDGIVPPSINIDQIDPACDVNVDNTSRQTKIETALSNSFGFGMVNACLIARKWDD